MLLEYPEHPIHLGILRLLCRFGKPSKVGELPEKALVADLILAPDLQMVNILEVGDLVCLNPPVPVDNLAVRYSINGRHDHANHRAVEHGVVVTSRR